MNTFTSTAPDSDTSSHQRTDMLTEVDFKWLMAGIGIWVDPQELHHNPDYAHDSVQLALRSACEPLHRCALALAAELDSHRYTCANSVHNPINAACKSQP